MRLAPWAAAYLAFNGAAALVLWWTGYPWHPQTIGGWIAFLLLAAPLVMAAESVGGWLWGNRWARKIESETAGQPLSFRRLAYALLIMLLIFAATMWLGGVLEGGAP
jgi:hypothetical protein